MTTVGVLPSVLFWLLTGEARLGASSLLRAVSLPLALKLGAGAHTASEYRAVAGRVCCSRNKSKHSTHTPARLQLLLVVIPPFGLGGCDGVSYGPNLCGEQRPVRVSRIWSGGMSASGALGAAQKGPGLSLSYSML